MRVCLCVCVCVSAHIITWKIETERKTGAFPVYIGVRPHSSRTSVGRATHWSYCVNRTQYSLWCAQSLNCADGLLQLWEKPFNVKISFIELNANRWWFCINAILLCPLRWIIHLLHALCRIAVYGLSGVSYTWWTLPVSELLSNRLWFGCWVFVPASLTGTILFLYFHVFNVDHIKMQIFNFDLDLKSLASVINHPGWYTVYLLGLRKTCMWQ